MTPDEVIADANSTLDYWAEDWAYEFADILEIEYRPEYADIITMAMHTALYKIADRMDDHIRESILSMWKFRKDGK